MIIIAEHGETAGPARRCLNKRTVDDEGRKGDKEEKTMTKIKTMTMTMLQTLE